MYRITEENQTRIETNTTKIYMYVLEKEERII